MLFLLLLLLLLLFMTLHQHISVHHFSPFLNRSRTTSSTSGLTLLQFAARRQELVPGRLACRLASRSVSNAGAIGKW